MHWNLMRKFTREAGVCKNNAAATFDSSIPSPTQCSRLGRKETKSSQ